MSVVRFISDLHFGHISMAKTRGFETVEEHDNHIIDSWNKIVHKKDVTYILGDLTMEDSNEFYNLDLLNGRKILVGGNHDLRQDSKELFNYVESISGIIDYKGFALSHCPLHPSEIHRYYRGNIHGHIHNSHILDIADKRDVKYINVCCEVIDYTPKTLEEIIELQTH